MLLLFANYVQLWLIATRVQAHTRGVTTNQGDDRSLFRLDVRFGAIAPAANETCVESLERLLLVGYVKQWGSHP
jgi:hypothetical protein